MIRPVSPKVVAYHFYKLIPVSFRNQLDIYRKRKYIEESGVIFIHIPKNAGSGISKSLYGRYFGHYKLSDYVSFFGKDIASYSILSIYRDPVERFVSSYKYAAGTGVDRKPSKKARRDVSECGDINDFVASIGGIEDLYRLDIIFWPQTYFLNPRDVERHDVSVFNIDNEQGYRSFLEEKGFVYSGLHNPSSNSDVDLDEESREKIKALYSSDYTLSGLAEK
ncbi:MAG: hypothetical protein CMI02_05830 [Oceanospirillaceae bacterium]|nr:hypothetical protein [Oceanospirillaceae bacterium]